MTIKNFSRHCQIFPGEQNYSQLRTSSLRIRQDSKTLKIGGQRQWECSVWSSNAAQAEWRPEWTMEGGYGRNLEALEFAHVGV